MKMISETAKDVNFAPRRVRRANAVLERLKADDLLYADRRQRRAIDCLINWQAKKGAA